MAWVAVASTAVKMGTDYMAKRKAQKQGAIDDQDAWNRGADSRAEAEAQRKDFNENVKPVAQQKVAEGLSQGRSKQYGMQQGVLARNIGIARKRIEADPSAPLGSVGAHNLGIDLNAAQQTSGLVMQDEAHKDQEAHEGAAMLAGPRGYTQPLMQANHNLQGLSEDRADRQRGLAMQASSNMGRAMGAFIAPGAKGTPSMAGRLGATIGPLGKAAGGYWGQVSQGIGDWFKKGGVAEDAGPEGQYDTTRYQDDGALPDGYDGEGF